MALQLFFIVDTLPFSLFQLTAGAFFQSRSGQRFCCNIIFFCPRCNLGIFRTSNRQIGWNLIGIDPPVCKFHGAALNGQIFEGCTAGERFFHNFRYTCRNIQCCQSSTADKCTSANCSNGIRNDNRCQAATIAERTLSDGNQAVRERDPDAKITKLGAWAGYSDQYACSFLDPMDPLFTKIQKMFLEEQNSIYGTDHIYGIDLFNELEAPSYEPSYLRRVSRQVYQSLEKADKKAVWLQMTWLFWNEKKDWTNERIKAYITAFPSKKSLLLDYYCERHEVWQQTDKYFGVPYIWCYLGNFGGNTVLVGNLYDINKRLENTFANGGKNFEGLGSTLEGFDCNPFVYNYVFEKAWDMDIHKDVPRWTEELAVRRIGKDNAKGKAAWKLLIDSIYADPSRPGQCAMLSIRPTFGKFKTYYANPRFRYSNKTLLTILGLMLEADGKGASYSFDVVNVTRQLLGNYFWAVFKDYEKAYQKGDFKTMKAKEQLMLGILSDMDRVLSTQSAFLMGKWISDARKLGANEKEKLYFEQNARNLLTTWGEKASLLNDYASRSWSGLISTFYAERWKMFFAAVDRAVLAGQNFDDAKYEDYKKDVTEYEERWWKDCIGTFPEQPVGNSVIISKELYDKYKPLIEEM